MPSCPPPMVPPLLTITVYPKKKVPYHFTSKCTTSMSIFILLSHNFYTWMYSEPPSGIIIYINWLKLKNKTKKHIIDRKHRKYFLKLSIYTVSTVITISFWAHTTTLCTISTLDVVLVILVNLCNQGHKMNHDYCVNNLNLAAMSIQCHFVVCACRYISFAHMRTCALWD